MDVLFSEFLNELGVTSSISSVELSSFFGDEVESLFGFVLGEGEPGHEVHEDGET